MEAATNDRVALEGEDEEVELREQVVLDTGEGEQLTLAIGGKQPTVSKVVLRGGQIPMVGQRQKGEHVELQIRTRVSAIHVIDKIDSKTGDITETIRKHVLKVEGVQVVE